MPIHKNDAFQYEATLDRVIDGDTVDLRVDLGFRIVMTIRVRLAGIDAPERGEDGFDEAATELERLLVGRKLFIRTRKTGKYGRWLAWIYLEESEPSVNDLMVQKGFAKKI